MLVCCNAQSIFSNSKITSVVPHVLSLLLPMLLPPPPPPPIKYVYSCSGYPLYPVSTYKLLVASCDQSTTLVRFAYSRSKNATPSIATHQCDALAAQDPDNIPARSRLFLVVPKTADPEKLEV